MRPVHPINRVKTISLVVIALSGIIISCNTQNRNELTINRNNFPDVLDVKNTPRAPVDWQSFCFSDQGAWFGFALPDSNELSFSGPFLMTNGRWIGKSIVNLTFSDLQGNTLKPLSTQSTFYPGKLVREIRFKPFTARMSLIFISSSQALVHVDFKNIIEDITVYPQWYGSIFNHEGDIIKDQEEILIRGNTLKTRIRLSFNNSAKINSLQSNDSSYTCNYSDVNITENNSLSVIITFHDERSHNRKSDPTKENIFNNPHHYLEQNQQRWDTYLSKALQTRAGWGDEKEYQKIAVKSVQTLINNWRCAYGDLLHDGLFPSAAVNYFNGFWAWDSWKHAVALVTFAPELAKDQIRTMYDYQNKAGMIADCIYADSTSNNWLNTKPPLSGWAIWNIFTETNDTAFIRELYPQLVSYHEWWYQYRDLNHNQLCEYGSSDGSLVAAKWESGMDNAIRFDHSSIVKIDESNYAFSQESVDLNAYLFSEKLYLSKMADILGNSDLAQQYSFEAHELQELIESKMFDQVTGYFYDINVTTEKLVSVQGPEGWIPLFTQLASDKNAERVVMHMLDTTKFNTYIPFPSAPVDDPEFSKGYWRGPVWLDQVYFAITALNHYGYTTEANQLTLQVFDRLEGLKEQAPIRENYWPLTGKGMRVNHFSWSAAHLLLLYQQQ